MCYLFILYTVQANMGQGKAYVTTEMREEDINKGMTQKSKLSTPHPSLQFLPPIDLSSCQSHKLHQLHHRAPHAWQTGPSSPP